MADETGLSKSTVHRLFQLFAFQPHRTRSFKASCDPFFVEKLRDIVGLYLDPPDKALVFCVDEKSQVQALERTQPMLPIGFGYVEGVTHDDKPHGTTTLFAALNRLDGSVLAQCKPRHRNGRTRGRAGDGDRSFRQSPNHAWRRRGLRCGRVCRQSAAAQRRM